MEGMTIEAHASRCRRLWAMVLLRLKEDMRFERWREELEKFVLLDAGFVNMCEVCDLDVEEFRRSLLLIEVTRFNRKNSMGDWFSQTNPPYFVEMPSATRR